MASHLPNGKKRLFLSLPTTAIRDGLRAKIIERAAQEYILSPIGGRSYLALSRAAAAKVTPISLTVTSHHLHWLDR